MQPFVDMDECQRDTPYFRQLLELNEKDLDTLEGKLDKVVRQCKQMVTAGKQFNHEQEQFLNVLWDISGYFREDTAVQSSMNKLLHALAECIKYQAIIVDQAARCITKNLSNFINNEIRNTKDLRQYFERVSGELDNSLQRASNVSKSRVPETEEMNNLLIATRRAFRHTAIDYVHGISMAQGKKRHEIIEALLSYMNAYSTFYHQGTDLCTELDPSLKSISQEVEQMRTATSELEKSLENRHAGVTDKDIIPVSNQDSTHDSLVSQDGFPHTQVTMHGYLFKRSANAFKTWNRRYFTLQNNQLVYRKRSGKEVTIMEEDLRLCTVKEAFEIDRRFCFEVVSPMKCHMLQADSEEMYHAWIDALQRGIGAALQSSFHDPPDLNQHDSDNNMLTVIKGSPSSQSPSLTPISTPEANKSNCRMQLWQEILKIPGNEKCCDCSSPDPRWASINLGITLCIECSGIHRSLGVHYSKVRSLTLDAWEKEVIKVMIELGNSTINKVYLASLDQNTEKQLTIKKATPDCERSVREEWIKSKYVKRLFVKKLPKGSSDLNCISAKEPSEESDTRHVFHRTWSVPRRRRRPQSHERIRNARKSSTPSSSQSQENMEVCDSSGEDSVLLMGEDLTSKDTEKVASEIQLISDDNSTEGEEEEEEPVKEPLEVLSPELLLFRAAEQHNIPVMAHALALGADKNWQNPNGGGRTAIHQAVISGSQMAVEYLLINGCRPNVQDTAGQTPLHLATKRAHVAQVCLLLKHRVDSNLEDRHGRKAVDLAVESNEPDVVTILRVASLSEHIPDSGEESMLNAVIRDMEAKFVHSCNHKRNKDA
ncbi:centaurin beta 1A isoform X2 [Oratosquilla oratoria]|uniref:centaurin beta 1A isoform X2 n=1 Tax=Oratosquilla oratoria TaxID=337810 RepID=UPI003F762EB3